MTDERKIEKLTIYMLRLWAVSMRMKLKGKDTTCINQKIKDVEYAVKMLNGLI